MLQIQIVSNYSPLSHNMFESCDSSNHLQKEENAVFVHQESCYRCALCSFFFSFVTLKQYFKYSEHNFFFCLTYYKAWRKSRRQSYFLSNRVRCDLCHCASLQLSPSNKPNCNAISRTHNIWRGLRENSGTQVPIPSIKQEARLNKSRIITEMKISQIVKTSLFSLPSAQYAKSNLF